MLPLASFAQSVSPSPSTSMQNPYDSCSSRSLLFNFDVRRFGEPISQLPIWHLRDDSAFFFNAGMTIDADGALNAYNAANTGLDDLSNAGEPGHWDGVLQDEAGNPLVQGPDDPFPGYYISSTALADWTKNRFDPTRFVDASRVPYIALPGDLARLAGARLGDFAVVFNLRNRRFSFAIFADIGAMGEGSIALADNVGIWSDARLGGSRGGMLYLVFPGSGDHRPKSVEEINGRTDPLFRDWGGPEQVPSCAGYPMSFHQPAPSEPQASQPGEALAPEAKPATDVSTTTHAHTP